MKTDLSAIEAFLACKTPVAWLEQVPDHIDILLIDHAHCERKAAFSAMNLMHQYDHYPTLLAKMSRLAREELRHFERVLAILEARHIPLKTMPISRYAKTLRQAVSQKEPERLIELLIIGALIEARSCERFARLIPYVDQTLKIFYEQLLISEARHFEDYLQLAKTLSPVNIDDKIATLSALEGELIQQPDKEFYFHSGPKVFKKTVQESL